DRLAERPRHVAVGDHDPASLAAVLGERRPGRAGRVAHAADQRVYRGQPSLASPDDRRDLGQPADEAPVVDGHGASLPYSTRPLPPLSSTTGRPAARQANMPPSRFAARSHPCARRYATTWAEREPTRHTTTTSRSSGTSASRPGTSIIGRWTAAGAWP